MTSDGSDQIGPSALFAQTFLLVLYQLLSSVLLLHLFVRLFVCLFFLFACFFLSFFLSLTNWLVQGWSVGWSVGRSIDRLVVGRKCSYAHLNICVRNMRDTNVKYDIIVYFVFIR